MPMSAHSILAGNCYLDRFGVIHEVKMIEKELVTFNSFSQTDGSGQSFKHNQTAQVAKFIEDLQDQVPCPGSKSWG